MALGLAPVSQNRATGYQRVYLRLYRGRSPSARCQGALLSTHIWGPCCLHSCRPSPVWPAGGAPACPVAPLHSPHLPAGLHVSPCRRVWALWLPSLCPHNHTKAQSRLASRRRWPEDVPAATLTPAGQVGMLGGLCTLPACPGRWPAPSTSCASCAPLCPRLAHPQDPQAHGLTLPMAPAVRGVLLLSGGSLDR